ncbi:uncharacterized protein LOC131003979 [Salvia miltiorrhiza]|uniref:uncharacterized protein LOC131003979 n=1 Tax=Salvia miltiorrhiza TaxID=226208 RepID=UPI0025AC516B|nr:uncharacterized protein LOC131003979 [Salvia miltiorrhiza]
MNDAIVIGEMIRIAREMVQKASDEEKNSQYFKDSLVAASKIIGVTIELGGKLRDKLPEGLQPETDPFWYKDEVHAAVDAASVETLPNKTRDMPENVDIPSFSLNVTQEFENAPSNVDVMGGIGAETHEGIGSRVDVGATAEVTEDVTEENEGAIPRGSGTGIQNDEVMDITITTDKDVVVDGSVNVGHGGMEDSLLDDVNEQEEIACDIAVAKKLKSAATDDGVSAKSDENLIAANKKNAKEQGRDVSGVVVEKIEVRHSNRVQGNFGRDANKKLMNATTTKSGVKVAYPKKK